jgi:hypothetical protein
MSAFADQAAEIFDAVVALRTAAERAAYLRAVCGKNQALRGEVEQLLQCDNGAFTPSMEDASLAATVPMEMPGTIIGSFFLPARHGLLHWTRIVPKTETL